jgi:hypothetical protein
MIPTTILCLTHRAAPPHSHRMGFDDLAKRMKESHGVQGQYGGGQDVTPEQMMYEAERAQKRSRANGDIVFGIILLVIGIAITAFTYDGASRQGGTYIVAYGPIVVGVIKLIRGIATLG